MRILRSALLAVLAVLPAGCATLKTPESPIPVQSRLDADDTFTVGIAAEPGVVITQEELVRCAKTLAERIANTTARTRPDGRARAWRVTVLVSRYDHGNPRQRRLQAGMGGMYIDAQVALLAADGSTAGEFAANRRYEWGGELGGQATIDDLEVMLGDYIGSVLASRDTVPVEKSLRMAPATVRVPVAVPAGDAAGDTTAPAAAVTENGSAATESGTATAENSGAVTAVPEPASKPAWRISPARNGAQQNAPVR